MTAPMTANDVAELETMTESGAEHLAALEAILFLSVEPVPAALLAQATGIDASRAQALLELLSEELAAAHRGLQLVTVAGGYRLVTKPAVVDVVRRYRQMTASVRLSRAALETLAIVAYKQPALRTEVEMIRGVDCAGVLKTLLDYRLVKIVGRRDVVGRPIVYGTTREFLERFGLKDLTELPTLKEFDDLVRQSESMAHPVAESLAQPMAEDGAPIEPPSETDRPARPAATEAPAPAHESVRQLST